MANTKVKQKKIDVMCPRGIARRMPAFKSIIHKQNQSKRVERVWGKPSRKPAVSGDPRRDKAKWGVLAGLKAVCSLLLIAKNRKNK